MTIPDEVQALLDEMRNEQPTEMLPGDLTAQRVAAELGITATCARTKLDARVRSGSLQKLFVRNERGYRVMVYRIVPAGNR